MTLITSASKMKFGFFVCLFIISIITFCWAENSPEFNKIIVSAEKGDPQAQYQIGELYLHGENVKRIKSIDYDGEPVQQNYKEAAKWFQKAANQGHVYAQYHLGFLYEFGKGVQQSNIEAIKWYQKAAKQGHKPSQDRMKSVISLEKPAAVRMVEKSINKIITILGDNTATITEVDEDKRASIHSILSGLFDFNEFAKCSLGNRSWKHFTHEQQKSFSALYQKYSENFFIQTMLKYLNNKNNNKEKVAFKIEEGIDKHCDCLFILKYKTDKKAYKEDKNKPFICLSLIQSGNDDGFGFKLFAKDGVWKAYEYSFWMSGQAKAQQIQFNEILMQNSPERLFEMLQKAINKQNAGA